MSRLLLLLIFAVWLANPPSMMSPKWGVGTGVTVFLLGYILVVVGVAVWARWLARNLDSSVRYRNLHRFNRVMSLARLFVIIWLAVGTYSPLGWGWTVLHLMGTTPRQAASAYVLPGLLLGTLPTLLAWIGLWWAQFPAEQSLREQTLLDQLYQDLPIHAPPTFGQYLLANLRLQILFMLLPILLILLLRDVVLLTVRTAGWRADIAALEDWIILPSAMLVFVFAPELLRRVLSTRPLEDSPLRKRLDGICRRNRLRYREILLWKTQFSTGNAAVMGLLPRMRYILLSDLLLETLTDDQIEAVFAHEVGHIVHRHMVWYVVFFAAMALAAIGPGTFIDHWVSSILPKAVLAMEWPTLVWTAVVMATTFTVFGFLSRRFERQADVFAARMLETNWGLRGNEQLAEAGGAGSHVGAYGAGVFASALHQVAVINNIPVETRSWCHGSIGKRMRYLHKLSENPALTGEFDRFMARLYTTLVLALVACGMVVAMALRTS